MEHADNDNKYVVEKSDKIRRFDCYVLSIDCKNGGGFSTSFPISPKEHREYSKARGRVLPDKVVIESDSEFTTFFITDDWGNVYEVSVDNHHYSAIEHATAKAREYGLLVSPHKGKGIIE